MTDDQIIAFFKRGPAKAKDVAVALGFDSSSQASSRLSRLVREGRLQVNGNSGSVRTYRLPSPPRQYAGPPRKSVSVRCNYPGDSQAEVVRAQVSLAAAPWEVSA